MKNVIKICAVYACFITMMLYGKHSFLNTVKNSCAHLFNTSLKNLSHTLAAADLGKTHFIVGKSCNAHDEKITRSQTNTQVFFCPDRCPRPVLLSDIDHERTAIYIAIFAFTDKSVAQSLLAAHARGVRIEVVTDGACLKDKHNKVAELAQVGIPVWVYDATRSKVGSTSTMHNKFVLCKSCENQSIVWTGSANLTKAAFDSNHENVLRIADVQVYDSYLYTFKSIQKQSYRLSLHTNRPKIAQRKRHQSSLYDWLRGFITTIPS